MVIFMNFVKVLVLGDLFHTVFYHRVCAYLDPGTGSMIIQIIMAGLFGGLFVIKLFWSKIKAFFKNLLPKTNEDKK